MKTDITHLSSISRPLPATYADFVKALKKPGEAILETLTGQQADLLHMAIGLSGEAAELLEPFYAVKASQTLIDRANVVEELGDLEFFLEGIHENTGIKRLEWDEWSANDDEPRDDVLAALVIASGAILDTVKRNTIYGKALDEKKLAEQLSTFGEVLNDLYAILGVTRAEVINHNVEKLATRYATLTYSDKQAQDRADKQS